MSCTRITVAHPIFSIARYVHVLHPEVDAAVAPRRGSMPTVSSSRGSYAPPDRRGSEPALLHATVTSSRRSQLLVHRSYPPQNNERVAADIAEEQSQGNGCFHGWLTWSAFLHTFIFKFVFTDARTPLSASWESVQSSEDAQACNERNEQVCLTWVWSFQGASWRPKKLNPEGLNLLFFLHSGDFF